MNIKLEDFLNSLVNWNDFFSLKSYSKGLIPSLDGVISNIRTKDVDEVFRLSLNFYEKDILKFNYPGSDTLTYAFASIRKGHSNFVFFSNDEMDAFWILAQTGSFVDCIITDNGYLYSVLGKGSWLPAIASLKKMILRENLVNDISELKIMPSSTKGVCISSNRPYHFFYDQLYVLERLYNEISVDVFYGTSFWDMTELYPFSEKINSDLSNVYLAPMALSMAAFFDNHDYVDYLMSPIEEKIINSFDERVSVESNSIKAVFGISSEKRSWLQQVEGYSKIIEKFSECYEFVDVVLDGMTSTFDESVDINKDQNVYFEIEKNISNLNNVDIQCIFGESYKNKIPYYIDSDIYIGSAGTSAMVPTRFTGTDSILLSSRKMKNTVPNKKGDFEVLLVNPKNVVESSDDSIGQYTSYHISWQNIFNIIVPILNKKKTKKLKKVLEPSVEDTVATYKMSIVNEAFLNFGHKINFSLKPHEILRDLAIVYESIGEYSIALQLMQQARKIHKDGPTINNKIKIYENKILLMNK